MYATVAFTLSPLITPSPSPPFPGIFGQAMRGKRFKKSLQDGWARVRRAVSPAPSRTSSTTGNYVETELPSRQSRKSYESPESACPNTQAPYNDAANSCTDLDPSHPNTTAVRAITGETKEAEASATALHVPYLALPDELPARETLVPEPEGQSSPALSVSQTLWNAAYDSLEEDAETTELVNSYVRTLMKVSGVDPATDLSAELKDTTQRQMHMRDLVEKGQAKIATPARVTETAGDVAQFILTVKPIIDAAIQNIPQAALPWAGILQNPAKATRSNLAGIVHVVSRMDWYCALSEHLLKKDHIDQSLESIPPQLETRVIELYKALLLYQMRSVCSYYRHQGLVFLRALANWDDWDGYLNAVQDAEKYLLDDWGQLDKIIAGTLRRELNDRAKRMENLLETISQDIRDFIALQKEMRRDGEDTKCLQQLFVVDPQDDMEKIEQKKDVLLHEAYKWILDTEAYAAFTNWNQDGCAPSSCRLLWVKGHAGTGKTMLLMGIILHLSSQSAKLAPSISHFFCQGTEQTLNSAMATLRSLIWLLLVQQPHLISYLRSKYKNAGPSAFQGDSAFIALSGVFKSMLKDPNLSPVYFIVDALDECEEGLPALIGLISDSLAITKKVKWLVSSRPIVELQTPGTAGALVELDTQKLEKPVNAYIDYKLSAFRGQPGYTEQVLDALSVEVPKRAENTFLWVWFFFKELGKTNRRGKLLLNGKDALPTVKKFPSGLSNLYDRIMDTIAAEAGYPQYCKDALAAVVLALRPLTLSELAVLAGCPSDMPRTVVEDCGSFLTVKGETVYLIHQSAKDYLSENYSSKLQPGGVAQGHANIGRRSITAMSSTLKRNIYNLDFKPDPLAPIRYSCLFWADHLLDSDSVEHKTELLDDNIVFQFLTERFLHWLEGISLVGKLPSGFRSLLNLRDIAQIYGMALVFSPAMSDVKCTQWKERLPFIETIVGIEDYWHADTEPFEGHSGPVRVVAFSPDGKTLATASETPDYTLRLWDVATGKCRQMLEGHRDSVQVVAFAPDGKMLASGSVDHTVRLWDVATGVHRYTLEGHSDSVTIVAFSPNSKLLAWTSEDCILQLCDVTTGICRQTLTGHSDQVQVVAFAPDGKTLASGSVDCTIRLWDVPTGICWQTLEGHSNRVQVVAFSSDGKTLASGSVDCTIRLWDVPTGICRQTLEGGDNQVQLLAFSPDGKLLASARSENLVQLWDLPTGVLQGMARNFNAISQLSFSEDNQYLKTNRV
ncbi:uncharacterized protein B0H64DRAFT_371246 [Chaetomium fimeti]|uniref:NACHT domain-containing protein n=1 Tax=Chaetomium fimeti TaxID=1854472 RepID=A0AAE0HLL8_9PEZI|nr:hypothetical protein B0H64DRAFT_371246 [Chaetomium fimeti]